jgi:uncharacterized protein (DUF1697 family)
MTTTHIALLRGINVGGTRKIPMARLRELLESAEFARVRTYIQSGNVLVDSDDEPASVAARIEQLLRSEFGFDVPTVVRSRDELAAVVAADPFGDVVDNEQFYTVSFYAQAPDRTPFDELDADEFAPELFELRERELYAWMPGGQGRSPMMQQLGRARFNPKSATARGWRTVIRLLAMCDE